MVHDLNEAKSTDLLSSQIPFQEDKNLTLPLMNADEPINCNSPSNEKQVTVPIHETNVMRTAS